MASKRILNRKDLRADYDAAERQKPEDEEVDEVEDEEEDEDEDEEEGEADGEAEAEADEEGDEDEDEEAPKKKKKKKPAPKPVKPKAKPRTRTAKVTRMKVVWGVFSNSNQQVATYEYPRRKEADEHAARLTTDKKSTHFVQPLKVPMEEKEKEK